MILGDAAFHHGLLVLGVIIFGVFRDVAEFAGYTDALTDLGALFSLEVMQLFFELCFAFLG